MTYSYKFIPPSLNAKAKKGNSPKDQYTELFQETLNEQFFNSSTWWTIKEESPLGSREYNNVDVRIAHVINAETGLKLGDDWKTVLFSDVSHAIELGGYYNFDDNIWLVINTEVKKNITATCTIRRCNNTLRWIDESTGIYYVEPCIIEYEVKEPRDYITQGSPFPIPGGFLHIYTQMNSRTNKINENQRFLFGNTGHWTGYKVVGTGINDFRNVNTFENDSARILTLEMIANFVNDEMDDIVNGIADVNSNKYTIDITTSNISGSPNSNYQLSANITYNGDIVARNLNWESSNPLIATVSGCGIVNFVSNGSCTITANISGNPAYDTCSVIVESSPSINSEILINPNTNYVLEGIQKTYSVYLYKNNIQQPDTFTISCNGSNVPSGNYAFSQTDGNHFYITNIEKDVESYLVISCTTGSVIPTKQTNIYLRGAWQFENA